MKEEFGHNRQYLTREGKPWFPVMGEMHYSRYNEVFWEESLRKIKAGGVSIVSTYVIWIHHEEEENRFDFTGCRDIRRFLALCQKVGLLVWLRLGPWVHGEVRNGGFPDWLLEKADNAIILRSNDALYLKYVWRFWEQVYQQVQGFLYEDGGPVIGIQIENEYGHCGGLCGEEGESHIRTLTEMVKKMGFQVPYYTATGWGGACIGDLLPVMGGYCEAPWDLRTTELEANENYVFVPAWSGKEELTFDISAFPYLTAELGGGIQVTGHRRPLVSGRDIGAMSLVKLGSGAAMLGYYMFHGGSNPKGKLTTLQETKEREGFCELPQINYDFCAPIRQYGMISDSYREIRLLACFLQDFGSELAKMKSEAIPEGVNPEDCGTLRLACRHDASGGYIFFNNYQRRRKMKEHRQVILEGLRADGSISFPQIDIGDGDYGFFPYQLPLGKAVLETALATPLCCLHTLKDTVWVFYGDREPQFRWKDGISAEILFLPRQEALNAWKVSLDQDYLILAEDFVWEEEGALKVTGGQHTVIRTFPELTEIPQHFVPAGQDGKFWVYQREIEANPPVIVVTPLEPTGEALVYEIDIRYGEKGSWTGSRETMLWISYQGKKLEVYQDSEMINDYFYTGERVPLRLDYFSFPRRLSLRVYPLYEAEEIYLEARPAYQKGKACRLEAVTVCEQFR
ncbi:MAG: beta-galactosidase [Lachnospiraceae bacterium]|nr:beta-galactosidase [Lachnospiraceae bacterium]